MRQRQDLQEATIIVLICSGTLGASAIFLLGVLIAVNFLLKAPLKLMGGSASPDMGGRSKVFPLKRVDVEDWTAAELEGPGSSPWKNCSGLGVLTKAVLVSAEDSIDSAVKKVVSCEGIVGYKNTYPSGGNKR